METQKRFPTVRYSAEDKCQYTSMTTFCSMFKFILLLFVGNFKFWFQLVVQKRKSFFVHSNIFEPLKMSFTMSFHHIVDFGLPATPCCLVSTILKPVLITYVICLISPSCLSISSCYSLNLSWRIYTRSLFCRWSKVNLLFTYRSKSI